MAKTVIVSNLSIRQWDMVDFINPNDSDTIELLTARGATLIHLTLGSHNKTELRVWTQEPNELSESIRLAESMYERRSERTIISDDCKRDAYYRWENGIHQIIITIRVPDR